MKLITIVSTVAMLFISIPVVSQSTLFSMSQSQLSERVIFFTPFPAVPDIPNDTTVSDHFISIILSNCVNTIQTGFRQRLSWFYEQGAWTLAMISQLFFSPVIRMSVAFDYRGELSPLSISRYVKSNGNGQGSGASGSTSSANTQEETAECSYRVTSSEIKQTSSDEDDDKGKDEDNKKIEIFSSTSVSTVWCFLCRKVMKNQAAEWGLCDECRSAPVLSFLPSCVLERVFEYLPVKNRMHLIYLLGNKMNNFRRLLKQTALTYAGSEPVSAINRDDAQSLIASLPALTHVVNCLDDDELYALPAYLKYIAEHDILPDIKAQVHRLDPERGDVFMLKLANGCLVIRNGGVIEIIDSELHQMTQQVVLQEEDYGGAFYQCLRRKLTAVSDHHVFAFTGFTQGQVLDVNTGQSLHTFTTSDAMTNCCVMNKHQVILAHCHLADVYDLRTGAFLRSFRIPFCTDKIMWLEGHSVVIFSGYRIHRVNADSGDVIREVDTIKYRGHQGATMLCSDGRRFVVGYQCGSIELYDSELNCLKALEKAHNSYVVVFAMIKNDQLASGSKDKTIKIWAYPELSLLYTLQGHNSGVKSLALMMENRLASGGGNGEVKIWYLPFQQCLYTFNKHAGTVRNIIYYQSGFLLTQCDEKVICWDFSKVVSGTKSDSDSADICGTFIGSDD